MYGDRGNCFDCNIAISKCVDTSGVCHYSVHFASNLFVSVLSKDDGLTQHQNNKSGKDVASEAIQRGTQNAQPPPYRPGRSL